MTRWPGSCGKPVGVGPGAPDLLTLRAVEALRRVDVILAAASPRNDYSRALETARPHLRPDVRLQRLEFPMTHDKATLRAAWEKASGITRDVLRGGENDALIAQIEGGIKKEVSVGCSVERCVCSICGEDINTCAHKKGEVYGGKVCCAELVNAQDAYEWSFVAVPAQPRAGVLKRCGGEDAGTLKTLVKRRGSRANQRELESLEKQAEVGKCYLSELRGEVKRLMLVCEQEADGEAIEKLAEKLDESELKEMEKLYRGKMAKKLGLRTQLTYGEKTKAAEDESDFRV